MPTFRNLLGLLALTLAGACSSDAVPTAPTTPTGPIASTPELDVKLAAADAKDGQVDKVVHRCAGCALGMDGKAEHSVQVGGYTLHLCKPACLARYQRDAVGELTKLTIR
ncbi:MAG: hypothetical protein MUC36_12565 [Planctomycetes bacterium]|jgi:hypothetical protein|nr:hypothetical protein [Planctomycetota bacterium]